MATAHRIPLLLAWFFITSVAGVPRAFAQIDIAGEWGPLLHEERPARADGQSLGDWAGIPLNDASRFGAEAWDSSIVGLPEHQSGLYSSFFAFYAPGGARITKVVDGLTQQVTAYRFEYGVFPMPRVIWMDGRDHPPEYAAHTWAGFSTGTWIGRTLSIETSHLKAGYAARNGVRHSDAARLVEYVTRHGTVLTVVTILHDPLTLDEPFVQSWNLVLNPDQRFPPRGYNPPFPENGGHPRGYVPHYLPGQNSYLTEFATQSGIPLEALRGGKETMYPEFAAKLKNVQTKPLRQASSQ